MLLIACGNVASLLLARASARRREFAIRAAIGASRGRLIRQLLSESVVLATAGGAGGVLIAWWVDARAAGPVSHRRLPDLASALISPSTAPVLAFALVASLVTAVIFGLAPAWSASKPELVPALKASAEGDERTRLSMRDVLVIGQLALSMVLLVAGALLGRGLLAAYATDLGYDPRPLSSLTFNLGMNGYDDQRASAFLERAFEALRALPGVEARRRPRRDCRSRRTST